MKRFKFISILSLHLLCFILLGCEKSDVFDGEQTVSVNSTENTPVDTDSAIIEINEVDLCKLQFVNEHLGRIAPLVNHHDCKYINKIYSEF